MITSEDDFDFLTQDELLGGLPARRASTVLFAIESRTAHLALRARQVGARYLTEQSAADQEHAFLDALSRAREAKTLVKIQELERYAPQWAPLVQDDATLRTAIVQLLATKYKFRYRDVPALRCALGLDDDAVREAFQRLYSKPLANIYQTALTPRARLAWWWARVRYRLEDLPPFWIAFSLTLTETVGAGILALPIAMAGLGPLGGVLVLLVLGVVSILTIAGLSEAIVHNGNMRYGNSYFGRLVHDYFGAPGTAVMTVTLIGLALLVLVAYYFGVATTLEQATGMPGLFWAALLFLVQLYFLKRGSIEATAASALVIGAVNITLIIALALLSVPYLRPEYLMQMNLPGMDGRPFDASILSVVFGVALAAYFGHTSAGNAAKVVLRRDPSGRALIRGNAAALMVAALVYSLWVLAVNGSISPAQLASETGTVLVPMGKTIGSAVYLLGSLFVVLAMGMGSIHMSLGLFFSARERLPRQRAQNLTTPKTPKGASSLLNDRRARFWIAASPVVLIFIVVEWLLWTKQESFSGVIGFVGALGVPILAGIFPMLLLVASRRKADYLAGGSVSWLGHPVVAGIIYSIFLASILVHGIYLFQDPAERLLAMGIALVILGLTVVLVRRGAFHSRQAVELKLEGEPLQYASFNLVARGKPSRAHVNLQYAGEQKTLDASDGVIPNYRELESARFNLQNAHIQELKVWAHGITPEGDSEPLPVRMHLTSAQRTQSLDLEAMHGEIIVPVDGVLVEILLRPDHLSAGT